MKQSLVSFQVVELVSDAAAMKPEASDDNKEVANLQAEIQVVDEQPTQVPELNETFTPGKPTLPSPDNSTVAVAEKKPSPVSEKNPATEETKKKEKVINFV